MAQYEANLNGKPMASDCPFIIVADASSILAPDPDSTKFFATEELAREYWNREARRHLVEQHSSLYVQYAKIYMIGKNGWVDITKGKGSEALLETN